jgi:hypothetical protein
MHDFITAQLESILQSTVGIGDVGSAAPPSASENVGNKTSSTAGSSTSDLLSKSTPRARADRETSRVQRTSSTHNTSGGKD